MILNYPEHFATSSERVLVLATSQAQAQQLSEQMATLAQPGDIKRRYLTNGQQRIVYNSGAVVHFRSANSQGHRGLSIDLLILTSIEQTGDSKLMSTVLPCLATSQGAHIAVLA